jgi:hypothetical protein
MQKFIKGSLLSLIFLLIQLQANTAGAEIIKLECTNVHTNPYNSTNNYMESVWYFDLDLEHKKARFYYDENGFKFGLETLYWNKNFIGLTGGDTNELTTYVASYLFDRNKSKLIFNRLNLNDLDIEYRKDLHGRSKAFGELSNALMSCIRIGGF